jgi:hypothetical protein
LEHAEVSAGERDVEKFTKRKLVVGGAHHGKSLNG